MACDGLLGNCASEDRLNDGRLYRKKCVGVGLVRQRGSSPQGTRGAGAV